MKKVIGLFIILFALLLTVVIARDYIPKNISPNKNVTNVTIKDAKFRVEAAETKEQKEIGLSEKTTLSQDAGMIFKFDQPGYYSFWMKNMKFPIDIIFINNDTITTIYKNVEPPKKENESLIIYQPTQPSNIILELSSGTSEKYGIKEGDKVKIENSGADK